MEPTRAPPGAPAPRGAALAPGQLSEHLSEVEFLSTSHRSCLEEQWRYWHETPYLQDNARRMADQVFEQVREVLGVPLHVTSGLRCPGLNAAVGGKLTSRHMLGLAVDVVPIGMTPRDGIFAILQAIRHGGLAELDAAIVERATWIHIQASPNDTAARHLVLESEDGREFARIA